MARTIAVMQPYLFPYLGYFQLIAAADVFVLGDDLHYVRSGWVNRNRILHDGEARLISFPLKKDRFVLRINQRQLCDHFSEEAERLIRLITETYERAPYFAQVMPLLERLIRFPQQNIALYAEHALREMCAYLHIVTPIMRSSDLILGNPADKQERIIRIAHVFDATTFITPEGGSVVYDRDHFARNRLLVRFFRMGAVEYRQFGQPFVANLSIIDVLMFNCVEQVQQMLNCYQLDKNPPAAKTVLLARPTPHLELVSTPSNRIAVE
ncbi:MULTISPECIES: WbqC family protein [unclassified Pseudomonas]|uniref:WbqC family protein n=1 Tax=unclassified Pseudomonas TaxID=196821 RepID=UPI0025E79B4D|nr:MULTISPECIES: WbqC family protein [unclassified Pseudomonas]